MIVTEEQIEGIYSSHVALQRRKSCAEGVMGVSRISARIAISSLSSTWMQ